MGRGRGAQAYTNLLTGDRTPQLLPIPLRDSRGFPVALSGQNRPLVIRAAQFFHEHPRVDFPWLAGKADLATAAWGGSYDWWQIHQTLH